MLRNLLPVLFLAGVVTLGGCVDPDVSNLISAGAKLASNPSDPPIGDLTTGEILAISHNLPQLAAQFPTLGITPEQVASVPQLTDEQAAALVEFLDANNVDSVSELQALILQASQGGTIVIPESLRQLLESMGYETDASKLVP